MSRVRLTKETSCVVRRRSQQSRRLNVSSVFPEVLAYPRSSAGCESGTTSKLSTSRSQRLFRNVHTSPGLQNTSRFVQLFTNLHKTTKSTGLVNGSALTR